VQVLVVIRDIHASGVAIGLYRMMRTGFAGLTAQMSAKGDMLERYQLGMTNVAGSYKMTVISGNTFSPSAESGDVRNAASN